MARDILSEYGPDKPMHQASRASRGGVMEARDVMNYKLPQGPTGTDHRQPASPGLHQSNSGNANRPMAAKTSGGPGIGGTVHHCGSQGKH